MSGRFEKYLRSRRSKRFGRVQRILGGLEDKEGIGPGIYVQEVQKVLEVWNIRSGMSARSTRYGRSRKSKRSKKVLAV